MAMLTNLWQRIVATPAYLTIALGTMLVSWQAMSGTLPLLVQWSVCGGLLFGIGIPHGALDHLIDRETALQQGKSFSFGWFLAKYLLTMAGYGLVWFIIPASSLLLFLLISAWHFGETDLEHVPPTPAWTIVRFVAGGFVLAFILLMHPTEVTPILERITHQDTLTLSVWHWGVAHSGATVWCWGISSVCLLGWVSYVNPVAINWLRLIRLVIVLALGYWLPLLLAFSLYFGGWHALSSFQTIYRYLRHTRPVPLTPRQIWLQSLPFTGLALVSLVVFGWWWWQYAQQWDPLPLLFIFLSLITLPHLTIMHGMNSRAVIL